MYDHPFYISISISTYTLYKYVTYFLHKIVYIRFHVYNQLKMFIHINIKPPNSSFQFYTFDLWLEPLAKSSTCPLPTSFPQPNRKCHPQFKTYSHFISSNELVLFLVFLLLYAISKGMLGYARLRESKGYFV